MTAAEIIIKIESLEEKIAEGVQSSDLNTGQTQHKVVFDLVRIEKALNLYIGKLRRLYPFEYKQRYGSVIVPVNTNRRK